MHGDVNREDILHAYAATFARAMVRLKQLTIDDGVAHLVVWTNHRGGQIGLDEVTALAALLGLDIRAITFWDIAPNAIEFLIDLEPKTPIERPPLRAA